MWIVYSIGALVLLYLIWTFNRFIRLKQRSKGAWSDIDVQLKRRWDLIPTLVKTVEGYASHEKDTLNKVVEARARATAAAAGPRASGVEEQGLRELKLTSALANVLALVEAYPDLKADQSFLNLHKSLVEIEDHLQYARRYYNAVVRDYNTLRESFPSKVIASAFGFGGLEFFQIEAAERATPRVELSRD
jgi:LemA protein